MSIAEISEGCIESGSEARTRQLGNRVGEVLDLGESVLLVGSLGAGKTCLTRGIAQGLNVEEHARVRSPSFSLVHLYKGRLDLYHVDLYRLSEGEIPGLAMEEIWDGGGVLVIEWAERMGPALVPPRSLWIRMEHTGNPGTRRISWGSQLPSATPGHW